MKPHIRIALPGERPVDLLGYNDGTMYLEQDWLIIMLEPNQVELLKAALNGEND